jgi:hypothetical protein
MTGLIPQVSAPPQKVDVHSLEPAVPYNEASPPLQIHPHIPDPERLMLEKQLLDQRVIKPQSDVIEDKEVKKSNEPTKNKEQ